MKKFFLITALIFPLLTPLTTRAGSIEDFCQKNAKAMHRSISRCVKAEKKAQAWLASNPVADDIYATCKSGSGQSLSLLKDCVLSETYTRHARAVSPLNLSNSNVWYTPMLRGLFPSLIRVCGYERPLDDFAVLPKDITRFHFSTDIGTKDMLPFLKVDGSVEIGRLPRLSGKKKTSGKYDLYIDAFLVSNDGRVVDISTTEGTSSLSRNGGTAHFSFEIGHGYYFNEGGKLLIVASGTPIKTSYPDSSCLVLGAKKLTFKK